MPTLNANIKTAGITPDLFPEQIVLSKNRALVFAVLALFIIAGFGLRAYALGAESLSEDELNKVRAVAEYREHGLTSANGEHPFLMKAMLAASLYAADEWNKTSLAQQNMRLHVSTETAARFPGALLGALTALLIFLVASELFGVEVGLIAAALWSLDPAAVGFNRIAKEDTFLLFFFLLANIFWLRGQRAAESGRRKPEPFYWATAAAFGAMLASKYVPHFISISGAYYYAFQGLKSTRWRMGKLKWLVFFAVMGLAFLALNPTILLPGTWHEMRVFAGEKRIGHDSYEYMGHLYRNQVTLWLTGSPWHFYYVFIGVKLPVPVIASFIAGLPMIFRKRMGDGRYFLIFWLFFWFFPFTVMGGKFTRYFTFALPVVLMIASIGIHSVSQYFARLFQRHASLEGGRVFVRAAFASIIIAFSAYASVTAAPHYRLYTNVIGGGQARAGSYFPHDEFYDASTNEGALSVARIAPEGARVASETPELFAYYSRLAGRPDLRHISLSDRAALSQFQAGDVVILARGRHYFSNDDVITRLQSSTQPSASISLGSVNSMRVYLLNAESLQAVTGAGNP